MTTHHDPFPSDGSLPFGSITLGGQRVPIRLHTTLPIYMAISIVSGLRFAPMYAGKPVSRPISKAYMIRCAR